MTQTNNTTPQGGVQDRDKKPGKAAQKLRFFAVVSAMALLCGGFIWFIFAPDKTKQPEGAAGLNMNIPAATVQTTENDKRKAYEQEQYKEKQRDKQKTLQEIGDSFLTNDAPPKKKEPAKDPIRTSQDTYQKINRQMSSFYETPKEDPQVADLKRQLVELTARLDEKAKTPPPTDPLELMEKSYELAAKYYPAGGGPPIKSVQPSGTSSSGGKEPAVAVHRAADGTTSTLAEPAPLTLEERNYAFNTAVGEGTAVPANAIRACIAENLTVINGSRVKLRLMESLQVGEVPVAENTLLYGTARIEGQRMNIVVTSIESGGNVIPVELSAFDTDGQRGLFVPNTAERTAAKDALADMGSSFGTSVSFAKSAGQQVAMDLTRGIMSGGSQYLASKMREVKVSLKAGYQILLIAKEK